MSLSPPEDSNYASFEQLYRDVQAHAKVNGYCLNVQSKHKNSRYEVKCDKAGKFLSKATDRANPKSPKKTNCPMRASACYDPHEEVWKFKVIDPSHNHPPSESPAEHARHRQEEREQQRHIIDDGLAKGDSVPVIYQTILDQFPDTITSLRDVDNMAQSIKKSRRATPSSIIPAKRKLLGPTLPVTGKKGQKKPWLVELRKLKEAIRARDKRIEALEQEKGQFEARLSRLELALGAQQSMSTLHSVSPVVPPNLTAHTSTNHSPGNVTHQPAPNSTGLSMALQPPAPSFSVVTPGTWKV
jgi:hypothetical protein